MTQDTITRCDARTAGLLSALVPLNTADAVERINTFDRDDVVAVLATLPLPRAVNILDQPELRDAAALVARLPDDRAADIFQSWTRPGANA